MREYERNKKTSRELAIEVLSAKNKTKSKSCLFKSSNYYLTKKRVKSKLISSWIRKSKLFLKSRKTNQSKIFYNLVNKSKQIKTMPRSDLDCSTSIRKESQNRLKSQDGLISTESDKGFKHYCLRKNTSKRVEKEIDCIILSSDDDNDDNDELVAEKILDKKYENDTVSYLVKWKNINK